MAEFRQFLRYAITLLVTVAALAAGWWLWNQYMEGPWTRDGKVRAEVVNITPLVAGRLIEVAVHDNQSVKKGDLLFRIDPEPYRIALQQADAEAQQAQAVADKARHEADRRKGLPRSVIASEDVEAANFNARSQEANLALANARVAQARWDLAQTEVRAPADGFVTNLGVRVGNRADTTAPLVALVDSHSFYVLGYFEETKLRHVKVGQAATLTLYSGGKPLRGEVESIGRAIEDQSLQSRDGLLPDVKPNVPWVRLAQRVPVRIRLLDEANLPALIAGTTCSIVLAP